jgi:GntR family transcriptional regulator / MocR family aminotransferase
VESAVIDRFIETHRAGLDAASTRRSAVYRQLLDAIRGGSLPPGSRLPSARRLATAWVVPRGAVDEAYAQLQAEGLVERRVGNGSFVAQRVRPAPAVAAAEADATTRAVLERLASWSAESRVFATPARGPKRLSPGMPDTASFPLVAWRRELARVLGDEHRACLSYGVPSGVPELRLAVARHLSLTRSIQCRPEQVLIVGSPRQGLELIARVLLAPGESVVVEDPGPLSMTRRFSLQHLDVVGVAPDAEGFEVAAARRLAPHAAAAMLMPLHQWPTGLRTSPKRRAELLDWSAGQDAWLVELDSLGEIVHDGAAPPALFSEDRGGRVIFLGNFLSLTFPAIRIAYLVLPEPLVDVFVALRGLMGEHNPVAMQMALAGFIEHGHLDAHVRHVRRLYRARRDALVQAAHDHLPDGARLGPVSGGVHACLHLHGRWQDRALAARLNACGLAVQPLSGHVWQGTGLNGLLLGYGADDEATINTAVREIGAALRAA